MESMKNTNLKSNLLEEDVRSLHLIVYFYTKFQKKVFFIKNTNISSRLGFQKIVDLQCIRKNELLETLNIYEKEIKII